jgi:hypothetical protein
MNAESKPTIDLCVPAEIESIGGLLDVTALCQETGIYFLARAGRVIYVGQTKHLLIRINQHRRRMKFEQVFFFHCDAKEMDELEGALIKYLAPSLNHSHRSGNKRAPQVKEERAAQILDLLFAQIATPEEQPDPPDALPDRLNRKAAATFLTSKGYPIMHTTLAKLACIGGGPHYARFLGRAMYKRDELLAWAHGRIVEPIVAPERSQAHRR